VVIIIFLSCNQAKPKRQRKTREAKAVLTKEIIEDDLSSGEENTSITAASSSILAPPKRPAKPKPEKSKVKAEGDVEEPKSDTPEEKDKDETPIKEEHRKEKKKLKKERKESKKKKKPTGPMHFTANSEPRALEIIGDLEPSVFNEVRMLCIIVIPITEEEHRGCLVMFSRSLSSHYQNSRYCCYSACIFHIPMLTICHRLDAWARMKWQ
jgi:hypothetical protein